MMSAFQTGVRFDLASVGVGTCFTNALNLLKSEDLGQDSKHLGAVS
jgi:hypothetical protein